MHWSVIYTLTWRAMELETFRMRGQTAKGRSCSCCVTRSRFCAAKSPILCCSPQIGCCWRHESGCRPQVGADR
jgi:hypothetical protein